MVGGNAGTMRDAPVKGMIDVEDGDCFGAIFFVEKEETSVEELGSSMQTVVFLAP